MARLLLLLRALIWVSERRLLGTGLRYFGRAPPSQWLKQGAHHKYADTQTPTHLPPTHPGLCCSRCPLSGFASGAWRRSNKERLLRDGEMR